MACGGNETDVKAKVKYEIEDILSVTTIYSNRIQCHFYYIALHLSLQKWWRVGVQQLRRAKDQFSQARISLVEKELSRKWIPATPPAYLIFVILKCKNYTLLKHCLNIALLITHAVQITHSEYDYSLCRNSDTSTDRVKSHTVCNYTSQNYWSIHICQYWTHCVNLFDQSCVSNEMPHTMCL